MPDSNSAIIDAAEADAVVSAFAMTVGFLQYWPALVFEDVAGDLMPPIQ